MPQAEYKISYTYNFNGQECKGEYYTYNLKRDYIIDIIEKLERKHKTIKKVELNRGMGWMSKDIAKYRAGVEEIPES